jgi:thiol:disulfide interchange protein DsbD
MKALSPLGPDSSGWQKLGKGIGVVLLVIGSLELIGAAAGGRDYLQPLKGIGLGGAGAASTQQHLSFKRIKSIEDLNGELAEASNQGKMVMFDFYADWCVYCKDYEKYVFTDPRVQQVLSNVVLLQADVTANDAQDKALLKHVKVTAPPAILFFDKHGTEMRGYRLVGSMNADEFLVHVNKLTQP